MIEVDVLASDWVDRTFLPVYVKARDIAEFLQDGSDGFEIFLEGVNEYCRIISIHGSSPSSCSYRKVGEDGLMCCQV